MTPEPRLPFYRRLRLSTWVFIILAVAFLTGLPHYQTSAGGFVVIAVLALVTLVLRFAVDGFAAILLAVFRRKWLDRQP